ncbi:MAG: CDP-alcohol phosphatidyltransferase family protein [Ruminococcus sp.]|nr:CDP-alcohol phosphatidyltransferase family protein [Ruminococcus sp.]
MAKIITAIRIICSFLLLLFPAFSPAFYALYLIAGSTDMIDGTVARKTGTVSEFGSKLDTAADIIMVAVCMIKLLPALELPVWSFIWIGLITVIKAGNIVHGLSLHGEFSAVHSMMNKVTGLLLFVLPLTVTIIDVRYSAVIVCAAATIAAIQERQLI